MNDSSTGGYLLPTSPAPANDLDLDVLFQGLIASVTGIAGNYVRPRWQPEPSDPPEFGTTWIAVGVSEIDDDQFPQQVFEGDGDYVLTRHELIGVLCSFYGPAAQKAMRTARDGLLINQNLEALLPHGILYMHAEKPVRAPALIKSRWTNKIDVTFWFRRAITETYDILSIEKTDLTMSTDGAHPIIITNP